MNPFTPALRELARLISRQALRLRLILHERRKLARLETQLGLLGWQQADFDAATQQRLKEITDYEREQARLMNESAALGLAVRQLRQKHESAHASFQAEAARLESERVEHLKIFERCERSIAAKRKIRANFAAAITDLEARLSGAQRQYHELLAVEPQTPEMHAGFVRVRERAMALPHEIQDLRTQQFRTDRELRELETALTEERATVQALAEQWTELRKQFAPVEAQIGRERAACEREKRRVERQIEVLEKAKASPFRQIGIVLADHELAPMNQPQALQAVQNQREVIEQIETEVAVSRQASAQEDYRSVIKSAAIWLGLFLFTAAIALALD